MINKKFEAMIDLENSGAIQLTRGSFAILRAYNDTKEKCGAEGQPIILTESLWDDDLPDALKMLDAGDVDSFVFADKSSGLMRNLTFMLNNGWKVESSDKIEVGNYGQTQDVLLMSRA